MTLKFTNLQRPQSEFLGEESASFSFDDRNPVSQKQRSEIV